jgi:hypothetical protein
LTGTDSKGAVDVDSIKLSKPLDPANLGFRRDLTDLYNVPDPGFTEPLGMGSYGASCRPPSVVLNSYGIHVTYGARRQLEPPLRASRTEGSDGRDALHHARELSA